MNARTEPSAAKPRFALLLATGFGLGYLPVAPGTWGSLGGALLMWVLFPPSRSQMPADIAAAESYFVILDFRFPALLTVALALAGLWAAGHAEKYLGTKDPTVVVIDEISGQQVALFAALDWTGLNWKYLLLGFILFRVFDIWKPFPARRMESLPGGWGIMADDWVAAIYAALGLWLARVLGL